MAHKALTNVLTGKMFDVPVMGTHAHSWIQKFDSEIEAFRSYANTYPTKTILLIDLTIRWKADFPMLLPYLTKCVPKDMNLLAFALTRVTGISFQRSSPKIG